MEYVYYNLGDTIEQKKSRVAIYCRVGPYDQATMQDQKERLYLVSQEHYIDGIAVYSDNQYSGLNLDRSGYNRLDDEIRKGKIRMLIVSSTSRIIFDPFIASDWMDKIKKAGVKLIIVNKSNKGVHLKFAACGLSSSEIINEVLSC